MNNTFSFSRALASSLSWVKHCILCVALLSGASVWAQNVPPTVSITGPANNSTYAAPANLTITAAAADSDGTISATYLYINGNPYGYMTAQGGGVYSLALNNLAVGTYTFLVVTTDNANASTWSTPVTVTVTNIPPTVSITGPANNSTFVAPANLTITAAAADSDGTITATYLYINGNPYGYMTAQGGGVYSLALNNLGVGTYTFLVVTTDNANASTWSTPVTITVTNIAPTVSMTGPANNSAYTAPAQINLVATAADSDGTIASVQFYVNGNPGAFGSSNGNGTYSYNWTNVPAGTHSVTAVARDNGNLSTTSAPVTIVVNPNLPPTISLIQPLNNAVYGAPATVQLKAAAADSDGINVVNFYLDGVSNYWYTSAQVNGIYAMTISGIPVGTHTLTAIAQDNYGKTTTSAPVTINVYPSVPPTVSMIPPQAGTTYNAPATVMLRANAADTDGTVSQLQFFNGATLLGTATLSSGNATSGSYVYAWANVPAGTYNITAKATDNSGSPGSSSALAITVDPNNAPTVSLTAPAGASTFTAPANISLTASAADNDGTIAEVQFYSGATWVGSGSLASGTATSGSYVSNSWANVPAGTYSLTAVAIDNDGRATTSSVVSITVNAGSGGTAGMYFINADHLGTPRLVENQSQQAVWKWDAAEAFGDSAPNENVSSGGAFVFNMRFPGQYFDVDTGTSYNYFRDYDPNRGGYVQSDPIGLGGGLNPYAYVTGDPVRKRDRFGLKEGDVCTVCQQQIDRAQQIQKCIQSVIPGYSLTGNATIQFVDFGSASSGTARTIRAIPGMPVLWQTIQLNSQVFTPALMNDPALASFVAQVIAHEKLHCIEPSQTMLLSKPRMGSPLGLWHNLFIEQASDFHVNFYWKQLEQCLGRTGG